MSAKSGPRRKPSSTGPPAQDAIRIAVIGGGISGLSAVHRLHELCKMRRLAASVVLLESSCSVGGQIQTDTDNGFLLEGGPDTLVLSKPAGISLCERLGLKDELVPVNPEHQRVQILHRGRLRTVPKGFVMMAPTRIWPFVLSPLFSLRGKIRIGMERFIPPRPPLEGDESLASFVIRRFGREALERIAEPILASLFTADADRLSIRSTLPRFLEMERQEGSVSRALAVAVREMRQNSQGQHAVAYSSVAYLRRGFGSIVQVLLSRLPEGCVRTGAKIEEIMGSGLSDRWEIGIQGRQNLPADAIIFACPAHAAALMLESLDSRLTTELERLRYASCATVNLVYRRGDLARPLTSFGFFVPRREERPLLACSFVSEKFRDRVPPDWVLLRAFLGGVLRPDIMDRDDEALTRLAHGEVRELLHLQREPALSKTFRFPRAMPQYEVGFSSRLESITKRLEAHPGLFLAGSAAGAVGLPDCIGSGERAALAAVDYVTWKLSGRLQPGTSSEALSASQASKPSGVWTVRNPRMR